MSQSFAQGAASIYRLETLAAGDTVLHRLHPGVKLLGTLTELVCILSVPSGSLGQLMSFILLPVVLMALGEVPVVLLLRRTALALPFCLAAGLANLVLDRGVVGYLGALPITGGLMSLLGIVLRTVLCVAAVLLLVALTPFSDLTGQLRRLHIPWMAVALLEMTYRYIGTLLTETGSMNTAYQLRAGKNVEMRHMGSFVGMLLLRSYDRAARVYAAMTCRGYGGPWQMEKRPMAGRDYLGLLLLCGSAVVLRCVNLPEVFGRWLSCWI